MAPESPPTDALTEQSVLGIVGTLVGELGGGPVRSPRLDDSLDRDLGISSLERVELLVRLERAFGVRLSDEVVADASTPRDLVAAVLSAAPGGAEAVPRLRAPTLPATATPEGARTIVDALRRHAGQSPDRVHIYLRNDDGTETPMTYGELLTRSTAAACGLQGLGITRGDRVALMLPTERAFFEAFLGTLLIGAVPVPLYPPLRADDLLPYTRRQAAILRNAGARVLLAFAEGESLASLMKSQVPSLEAVTTLARLARPGGALVEVSGAPDDGALIQYTSGSTGDPKGVLLSHANILANVRGIGRSLAIDSNDVGVSWLPLYHDMGLIGMWLGALYFGAPVAIMSPLAFLARPARWLRAIHAHRGTISAAPNFAFDLCTRRIEDQELEGLDLSSWRLALNGAEAVNPDTIDRFSRRFGPYGFRATSMCPSYGLAESSVALTLSPLGMLPRVDRIARDPFERARELRPAAAEEPHPLRFVSCGRALPEHDVRIGDPSGRERGEREEGPIFFRGPSMTRGYFQNPEATRAVTHDGWMASGDLGYWSQGQLFITGREKDIIIRGGHNIFAEEVEQAAAMVPGIRKGCVAAFGSRDDLTGTERFIVVAETREQDAACREALRRAVLHEVATQIGLPPDVVVIADSHTVLKTPNGKIRRGAMRDAYARGTMGARPHSAASQWVGLIAADLWGRMRRASSWSGRFLYTGYTLLVLLVTLPAFWLILLVLPAGRRAARWARTWSRLVLWLGGVPPRVSGSQHLAGLDSAILVANHASYLDALVLMAAIPAEFHFVAKRALVEYPLIGTVIRKAGHSTIEKSRVSDRLAGAGELEARLRAGGLLAIFPEGTFARHPGLLPFRLGAFRAAVETGRPVVPVAIRGTRRILPEGTRFLRHGPIDVIIGQPLTPGAPGWPEMVRLRDEAVQAIGHGCGESPVGS